MAAALPPLRYADALPRSADLVVIGGGIVGAATAFFAARAGLSTVILEKRPALCTLTTPVSTGAFRLQFDNPEEIALVREGVDLFERFAEVADLPGYDIGLRQQGYLFCTTDEAGMKRQQEWVSMQHGWGLDDVELLPGDEVRYRFPHIAPTVLQARYRAKDGWLKPKALTMGYARASGATICLETPATGFVMQGDRVVGVETPRGTIGCQHVVLAAGPFSGVVAKLAGLDLELRPRRRMKLVIPELPDIPADSPMTIDEETVAHWRPALRGAYALFTDPSTPDLRADRQRHAGRPVRVRPAQPDLAALAGPDQPVLEPGLGEAASRTGSSRPASTSTPRTTGRTSGRAASPASRSTAATAATASWRAPAAAA